MLRISALQNRQTFWHESHLFNSRWQRSVTFFILENFQYRYSEIKCSERLWINTKQGNRHLIIICYITAQSRVCSLIFQTAFIPDELYTRVYEFCKRLLTFPNPYGTIGLSYARQIRTERAVPGNTQLSNWNFGHNLNKWLIQSQRKILTNVDIIWIIFCQWTQFDPQVWCISGWSSQSKL